MKKSSLKVFDETIHDTTPVYTSDALQNALGSPDMLSIVAVVDEVPGAVSGPTLTVAIQHSADGVHWSSKNATPEINAASTPRDQQTMLTGADAAATPSLGLVRLKLTLGGTAVTPQAHVVVHVTGRDT